jgi:hypothetical protein
VNIGSVMLVLTYPRRGGCAHLRDRPKSNHGCILAARYSRILQQCAWIVRSASEGFEGIKEGRERGDSELRGSLDQFGILLNFLKRSSRYR